MTSYSAAEAISPAIEATKLFLFKPFRWQTFFKLTLVAMLTEGGVTGMNFNGGFPQGGNSGKIPLPHWPAMHLHWPAMAIIVGIVAAVLLVVIPIGLLLSYLIIRLRFSFFDCVIRRQHLIGPAWSRYHRPALRYLGFTVVLSIAVWIVIGLAGYAIYQHFKPLFDSMMSGGQPSFTDFLPVIAVVVPLFLVMALVGGLLDIAMNNFVLPHMALEDATIGDSFADVWSDFVAEPGQFLLFLLLRFVLSLVAGIIGMIGLAIPMVFLVGICAVIVLLLKAVSVALAIAAGVITGAIVLAILVFAAVGVSGTIGTFRLMYAVIFYAGRYPAMGNILQPPAIPPPIAQPTIWPNNPISPGVL